MSDDRIGRVVVDVFQTDVPGVYCYRFGEPGEATDVSAEMALGASVVLIQSVARAVASQPSLISQSTAAFLDRTARHLGWLSGDLASGEAADPGPDGPQSRDFGRLN
ncbi:MAG: hypothetical protein P4L82_12010 [Ancalomicrobiaceae bacterium]|nr:hypothetical protein [Ancalomicrobiaceae bacterium]